MPSASAWLLTPQRIALHRPTATAVLADLHLGYAETRRRGGDAVPTRSLEEALAPLAMACSLHPIRRLVIAGDCLESMLPEGLVDGLRELLSKLDVELEGIVPGNHDRRLGSAGLPLFPEGIALGDWLVVHGDGALPSGKVVHGHLHPCLRLTACRAAPCYLTSETRIVLPAFSTDAAGYNVLSLAGYGEYGCHAIAGEQVLDFGLVRELRKRLRQRRP